MERNDPNDDVSLADDMAQILFTNLLLLGMEVADMEAHNNGISFNKDMFNLPNKVGAQAVLHFLFNRLNPCLSDERFKDCWRITDKKREMQFRKTCNSWIVSIQKNDVDAHLPKLNPALLLSPGGKKFIHLMYSLSTYVLTQVMKNEHDWKPGSAIVYPSVSPSRKCFGSVILSSIRDNTVNEMQAYFNHLHLISGANHTWKAYTDELVKEYRGLTKKLRDIEHEKRRMVTVMAETATKLGCPLPAKRTLTMFDSDIGVLGIKRGQRIEQARSRWKTVNNFAELFDKKREIVQSIVDNTFKQHKLEGTDIGVCVPGLLLREFKKEIQQQQIDSVYVGGRLNLVSVLQMWNLCLRRYLEQLSSEGLPDVSEEIPDLNAQAHRHHSFLKDTHSLRDELTNVTIPDLQRSIQDLHEKLSSEDFRSTQFSLGLELTKPVSPVSIPPSLEKDNDSPFNLLISQSTRKDTPDAVAAVIQSVASKSQAMKNVQPSRLVNAFTNFGQSEHTSHRVSKKEESLKRKEASLKGTAGRITKPSIVTKDTSKGKTPHQRVSSLGLSSHQSSLGHQKSSTNIHKQKPLDKSTGIEKRNGNMSASSLVVGKENDLRNHRSSKVLDVLANSIVDSVIFSDEQSHHEFNDTARGNDNSLSESHLSPLSHALASELEMSAFISHDRLGRSPQEKESVKRSESVQATDGRFSTKSMNGTPLRPHSISRPFDVSSTSKDTSCSSVKEAQLNSSIKSPATSSHQELFSRSCSESTTDDQNVSNSTFGDAATSTFNKLFETIHSESKENSEITTEGKLLDEKHSSFHSSPTRSNYSPKVTSIGSPKCSPTVNGITAHHSQEEIIDSLVFLSDSHTDLLGTSMPADLVGASPEHLLGDRLCGDGEASEDSALPSPSGNFGGAGDDSENESLGILDIEENAFNVDDNDDFLVHTRKFISSFTSSTNLPDRGQKLSPEDNKDDGLFHVSVPKGKSSSTVTQSFFDMSADMQGLVESDADEGLNDSFAPLKQGILFDNISVERARLGSNSSSPLSKAKHVTAMPPDFPSHFLSSPSLLVELPLASPAMRGSDLYSHSQPNLTDRLAQLQAKAALVLADSDDESL